MARSAINVTGEPGRMKPLPGGTADPRHIVGRDEQIEHARTRLREGNNLVVTDPRRMGKTGFLERMAHLASGSIGNELVLIIDYEGVDTADEFLRRTVEALRDFTPIGQRVKEAVRNYFDEAELDVGPLRVNATFRTRPRHELLERTLARIDKALIDDDRQIVLALDEIPLALANIVKSEGRQSASLLLQALRRVRGQRPSAIRWVLAGSVGFHHVLRLAGTTTGAVNDLLAFEVGPLEQAATTSLARQLLEGVDRSATSDGINALAARSGGVPWLVHQLTHQLRNHRGVIGPDDVEDAWAAFVSDRDASHAATHFVTRLVDYYEPDERTIAEQLLDTLAVSDVALPLDALRTATGDRTQLPLNTLRTVVDNLDADHYLRTTESGDLCWRYPVIRDIWIARRRLST